MENVMIFKGGKLKLLESTLSELRIYFISPLGCQNKIVTCFKKTN